MQVTRTSPLTGNVSTLEIDCTQVQLDELNTPNRRLLQQIFPQLNQAEREFIKTGYTQGDWEILFGLAE